MSKRGARLASMFEEDQDSLTKDIEDQFGKVLSMDEYDFEFEVKDETLDNGRVVTAEDTFEEFLGWHGGWAHNTGALKDIARPRLVYTLKLKIESANKETIDQVIEAEDPNAHEDNEYDVNHNEDFTELTFSVEMDHDYCCSINQNQVELANKSIALFKQEVARFGITIINEELVKTVKADFEKPEDEDEDDW